MKDGRLIKVASKPERGNTGTLPANRRYAIAYPINNTAHPRLQELKLVLPRAIHREFIWDPTEPTATRPLQFRMPDKKTNHFYMFDGNKNVSDLIYRVPDNGVAAHYEYAPFGAVTRTHRATPETQFNFITDNPYRFSSEYHDDDLVLVYYNYRHYNPKNGCWLNRDPIEERGGLNLYSFLSNNMIYAIDYNGLFCEWINEVWKEFKAEAKYYTEEYIIPAGLSACDWVRDTDNRAIYDAYMKQKGRFWKNLDKYRCCKDGVEVPIQYWDFPDKKWIDFSISHRQMGCLLRQLNVSYDKMTKLNYLYEFIYSNDEKMIDGKLVKLTPEQLEEDHEYDKKAVEEGWNDWKEGDDCYEKYIPKECEVIGTLI